MRIVRLLTDGSSDFSGCPDLVVPIGSQSIVGVPSLAAVAALDAGDVLDIVDPILGRALGSAVFRALFSELSAVESTGPCNQRLRG